MRLRHRIEAIVPSPNETRRLAMLLIVMYACIAVALVAVPWQQTAHGEGRVVAYAPLERQQIVQAPIEGRVSRWHVLEGSRVKRGDPIVDLTDNDPEIHARLRAERDALVARIDAANARARSIDSRAGSLSASRRAAVQAAEARRRMAGDRVRAALKALEAAEAQNRVTALNLIRQEKLFNEGLTSKRQLELAQAEGVKARTEVERARAALDAAERDESALDADRLKVGTDGLAAIDDARVSRAAALAEVASARAELTRIEVRLARQEAQAVTAPRDGTILRLPVPQGTAIIVPDGKEPWPSGRFLRQGTRAQGWVLLNRVRLGYEMWRRFNGFPPAIASDEPSALQQVGGAGKQK